MPKTLPEIKVKVTPEPPISAETKSLLQSKTTWGVLLMILSPLLTKWAGIDLSAETQGAITEDVLLTVGGLLAIWGRISASTKIDGLM